MKREESPPKLPQMEGRKNDHGKRRMDLIQPEAFDAYGREIQYPWQRQEAAT